MESAIWKDFSLFSFRVKLTVLGPLCCFCTLEKLCYSLSSYTPPYTDVRGTSSLNSGLFCLVLCQISINMFSCIAKCVIKIIFGLIDCTDDTHRAPGEFI